MGNLVIIKRYGSDALNPSNALWKAEMDAALLRENDIECMVGGGTAAMINPAYAAGSPIYILGREEDTQKALLLLGEAAGANQSDGDPELGQTQLRNTITKYGKVVGIILIAIFIILVLMVV